MDALILSCSTGGGHNSAAKAIAKELKNRGWKTTFFDPYSLRSPRMAIRVGNAYVDMVRLSPALFGAVYEIGKLYQEGERMFHLPDPVLAVQRKTALKLQEWLEDHPVDVVICTHPYPGLMLTWLKDHGYTTPPSIMVPTDYTCIPFESDVKTDWMTLPYPTLAGLFHEEGVARSRMIPSGIPVDPAYEHPISKKEACKRLRLDPKKKYTLVGGGSMGIDGIWSVINQSKALLDQMDDLELLVLCGHNTQMIRKIEGMNDPRIHAVKFTTHMFEYLTLASLFITKPGGLSITEAAACRTPMILTCAIPGCETANAKFFENHGWARYAKDIKDLPDLALPLLQNAPERKSLYPDWFANNSARLADWIERMTAGRRK